MSAFQALLSLDLLDLLALSVRTEQLDRATGCCLMLLAAPVARNRGDHPEARSEGNERGDRVIGEPVRYAQGQ